MTREHDIKELAVYIRHGLVKLKNHRPEFCDFAWANRDAMIRALSSLAAENGRMRTLLTSIYPAMKSEHDAGDGHFSTAQVEAVSAALSSPAPEGKSFTFSENNCPGHVASADNPKVCDRCGTHIDSLRPPDGGDDFVP